VVLLLGEALPGELVLSERDGRVLLGYMVAMRGVDEVHLLNITVSPDHRRQGWGRFMLDALVLWSRGQGAHCLWLEVRESNAVARALYTGYGFHQVGLRKGYYPDGPREREHAVVMSLLLDRPAAGGGVMSDKRSFVTDLDARQRAMLAEMGVRVWAPRAARLSRPPRPLSGCPCLTSMRAEPPVRPAPVTLSAPRPPAVAPVADGALRPQGIEQMDWDALRDGGGRLPGLPLGRSRTNTCSAPATCRPTGWWWARRPARTKTCRANPSSVRPANCWTGCCRRWVAAARGRARKGFTSPTCSSAVRPPTATRSHPKSPSANRFWCARWRCSDPRLILAMGRFAVQTLLGSNEPIGRLRGQVHHYQGVPVVVTYHPAYLLRNPIDKRKAWADLCLAMDTAGTPLRR
jgi:uracil-DNA glycosylase